MRAMISYIKKYYLLVASIYRYSKILIADQGYFKSIRKRQAVNAADAPIPWYTYPAIEFLNTLDLADCDVFEFGSGNSSVFWSNHARSVTSVEDDKNWFEQVQKVSRENQRVLYGDDEASYIAALQGGSKSYDVIVIDGRWRLACVLPSIAFLKKGGLIILDNSERPEEVLCAQVLRENGFFQVDFNGFGPINSYCWATSIFVLAEVRISRKAKSPELIGAQIPK
jgi:hypothetical protein